MSIAYIGRNRHGKNWHLLLYGFEDGSITEVHAEVQVPNDELSLGIAEGFLVDLASAKDLTLKARRGNDE